MTEVIGTEKSHGRLGRDAGVIGRGFRLIVGVALAGYVGNHAVEASSLRELAELGIYFIAILGAYTVAQYLLGARLLARTNAWLGTVILLGPVFAVFALQLGPHVFHHALALYIGVSLICSYFTRYGGCEVMSIPGLIFGRYYTVYCPLNAIDVVEKAATGGWKAR